MLNLKTWGVLSAAALMSACATATPYQATGESGRYGYAETKVESNRYTVSFAGNSLTDRETVETYLLYRAAELTLQNGYDYFQTVNRETEEEKRLRPNSFYGGFHDPYYRGFNCAYSYYSPRRGWYVPRYYRSRFASRYGYRSFYDPFYDPFDDPFAFDEITKYEANAEILMGYGDKPADTNAFNAREVMENLRGKIVLPEVKG